MQQQYVAVLLMFNIDLSLKASNIFFRNVMKSLLFYPFFLLGSISEFSCHSCYTPALCLIPSNFARRFNYLVEFYITANDHESRPEILRFIFYN